MVNFGQLAAEIHPVVWGTPANFNGFRVLAALLHVTLVGLTLRRWTEGDTYIRQGGHHVGHWPTFLVFFFFSSSCFSVTVHNSLPRLLFYGRRTSHRYHSRHQGFTKTVLYVVVLKRCGLLRKTPEFEERTVFSANLGHGHVDSFSTWYVVVVGVFRRNT